MFEGPNESEQERIRRRAAERVLGGVVSVERHINLDMDIRVVTYPDGTYTQEFYDEVGEKILDTGVR